MIDLHFHCLPGIDDGPATWDESVALCRAAADDGVSTIVATPHVLRDPWLNEDQAARDEMIVKLNALLGGTPAILPGCEYYFSSDALELSEMGSAGPLTTLNRSRYLLLEFPATRVPEQAEAVLYELALAGITPIIAHVERNLVFAQQPQKLARFIEIGALAQVTAASITGAFGRAAWNAVEEFFARDLIHLVGSDAHSIEQRPPSMTAARLQVRDRWGEEAEHRLFDSTPTRIIRNEPIVAPLSGVAAERQ